MIEFAILHTVFKLLFPCAKDFIYDDTYVETTDGFNHSKWLSFMNNRLKIAKMLLKPSGVIFLSIDDNEMAQLKLLCEEIFGANNFVGVILWKKKTNGNNMGWLPPVHDYILCFSKSIDNIFDMGFEVSKEEIEKNIRILTMIRVDHGQQQIYLRIIKDLISQLPIQQMVMCFIRLKADTGFLMSKKCLNA